MTMDLAKQFDAALDKKAFDAISIQQSLDNITLRAAQSLKAAWNLNSLEAVLPVTTAAANTIFKLMAMGGTITTKSGGTRDAAPMSSDAIAALLAATEEHLAEDIANRLINAKLIADLQRSSAAREFADFRAGIKRSVG